MKRRWGFLFVAALAIGAILFFVRAWVQSDQVNGWLMGRLIALYDENLQSTLKINRLVVEPLSLSLEARGVTIAGPGPVGQEIPIEADRVRVRLRLLPLLSRIVQLKSVLVDRPRVSLHIDESGRDNLSPLFQKRNPSPTMEAWDLFAENVQITRGSLKVSAEHDNLSASLRNLDARGSVDLRAGLVAGRFAQSGGDLHLADMQTPLNRLEAEGAWHRGKKKLDINLLKVELPGLKSTGAGMVDFREAPTLAMRFDARIVPTELPVTNSRLAAGQFQGPYTLEGKIAGPWSGLRASGEAEGKRIKVVGIALSRLQVLWQWSPEQLTVKRVQVALAKGNLEGHGELQIVPGRAPNYQGEVHWQGVRIEEVFPFLPMGIFRDLSGTTSGQASLEGGGEAGPQPHKVTGRVSMQVNGEGSEKMGIPPLELDADVTFAGDRFRISRSKLVSRGLALEPRGELTLDGGVDLQFPFQGSYRPVWIDFLKWEGQARQISGQGRLSGSWDHPILVANGDFSSGEIEGVPFSTLKFSGQWDGGNLRLDDFRLSHPDGNLRGKANFLVSGNLFGKKPAPFLRGIQELGVFYGGVDIRRLQHVLGKSWPIAGNLSGSLSLTGSPENLKGNGEIEWLQGEFRGDKIPSLRATVSLDSLRPGVEASGRVIVRAERGEIRGLGYDRLVADLAVSVRDRFRTGSTRGKVDLFGGGVKSADLNFTHLVLEGSAEVDGKSGNGTPSGEGTAKMEVGSWRGESFSSLQGTFGMTTSRELRVGNLAVVMGAGSLLGKGYYRWEQGEWGGELTASPLDLSKLKVLASQGSEPRGVAQLQVKGSGNRDGVTLAGDLQLSRLSLWRHNLGEGRITLRGQGRNIEWSGGGFGGYQVRGSGNLAGNYPFTVTISAVRTDLAAFVQQATGGKAGPLSGTFTAEAVFTGNLRSRTQVAGSIRFQQLAATLFGVELTNSGPIELAYQGGKLTTNRFHLQGGGTDLNASGSVILGERADLTVSGTSSLGLLSGQIPQVRIARGTLQGQMKIAGPLSSPRMDGTVALREGAFTVPMLGGMAVTDLTANGEFSDNRFRLFEFRGRMEGGGQLSGSGEYFIAGKEKGNFRLVLDGEHLTLRYPTGLNSRVNAQLLMEGRSGSRVLSGQVFVERAVYHRQIDLKSLLTQLHKRRLEPFGEQTANLNFNVEIASRDGVLIDTNLARLEMGADLMLSGNLQRPSLTGRAEIKKGKIFFRGTEFSVSSGTVDFFDPNRFVPYFDLVAGANVKSYQVSLKVNGTPDEFTVGLSSNPPLNEVDIVSLITLGMTGQGISQGQRNTANPVGAAAQGASTYLAGELDRELEKGVRQITGLDRFQVDPYVVGAGQGSGPRVTVGKSLSKDLSVTYSSIVGASEGQLLEVEYHLTRALSLVGIRGERGEAGVDLKFSFRFR